MEWVGSYCNAGNELDDGAASIGVGVGVRVLDDEEVGEEADITVIPERLGSDLM